MRLRLLESFPDTTITKTAFYRFVRQECSLNIKKVQKLVEKRTLEDTIKLRKQIVQGLLDAEGMDFEKNAFSLMRQAPIFKFVILWDDQKGYSVKSRSIQGPRCIYYYSWGNLCRRAS